MTVLISTCTRDSILAGTAQWMLHEKRPVDIIVSGHPIDWNRNEQVRRFLKSKCDHIFFLDSDSVPIPGTIEALLVHEKDAVVAPNLIYDTEQQRVRVMAFDLAGAQRTFFDPSNGNDRVQYAVKNNEFEKIGASGMSGLLCSRRVFETISEPWFRFEYSKNGAIVRGEDFYFYDRLCDAGIELWCDYSLVSHHSKQVDLRVLYDKQENDRREYWAAVHHAAPFEDRVKAITGGAIDLATSKGFGDV